MATTQLRKELNAEIRAQKKADRRNTLLDRIWQGVSTGVILFLAWYEILRHIDSAYPVNFILAGIAIAFLTYNALAPEFRR